ncbi:hypothetical protein D3C72_1326230 [compost metagenome]
MAGKCGAGVLQKTGVLDGCGANDDVPHAGIDIALDGVQVADAAAQLHRQFIAELLEDGLDDMQVLGLAGKCAIQIHQMQAARARIKPTACDLDRVFAERGGLIHIALFQAYAVTVLQINGRNEQHGCGWLTLKTKRIEEKT